MIEKIRITYGSGEGLTKLSAFDRALWDAGIANFNLIELTSIIPKKTKAVIQKVQWNNREIGNKLYVVLAIREEDRVYKEAWAGIGWAQTKTGEGVIVEHMGSSKEEVIQDIKNSLITRAKATKRKFGKIHYKVQGIKCKNKPVCAIVCAIFKSEGWD